MPRIDIQVGRTVAPVKAIIAEIRCAGILGMDYLVATGGVLNFRSKTWMLNGVNIQCTDGGGEPFVGTGRSRIRRTRSVGSELPIAGRASNC